MTKTDLKDLLSPTEAIEYFGLSRRKLYALIRKNSKMDFIAFYGKRRLIIRTAFEKYLAEHEEK
jgi:excisionase family DNA binding protein